jgi:hypothetical protein
MNTKVMTAQQAKEILEPIPKEDFLLGSFTDGIGKCCSVGHLVRAVSDDPTDYGDCVDYGGNDGVEQFVRRDVVDFIERAHNITNETLASVNNDNDVNGYTQDNPKDRVMALLNDMINEKI